MSCGDPNASTTASQIQSVRDEMDQAYWELKGDIEFLLKGRPYMLTPVSATSPLPRIHAPYDTLLSTAVKLEGYMRRLDAVAYDANQLAAATASPCTYVPYEMHPYGPWGTYETGHKPTTLFHKFADFTGDGKADYLWFSDTFVYVAPSEGTRFFEPSLWLSGHGPNLPFDLVGGWGEADETARNAADVDGDGKTDIIAFGPDSVRVGLSQGKYFATPVVWTNEFTSSTPTFASSVEMPRSLADVNGDKKADVIGFARDGVYVALSTGQRFAPMTKWLADFGNADPKGLWPNAYQTPRVLADVNGDGKADIVGLSSDQKVWVSLSTGTAFGPKTQWLAQWTNDEPDAFSRALGDVDGDGKADLLQRTTEGASVSLSTGSAFAPPVKAFADDPVGLSSFELFWTGLGDANGDKKADIIAVGAAFVNVAVSHSALGQVSFRR
jgi:hypothetical protein